MVDPDRRRTGNAARPFVDMVNPLLTLVKSVPLAVLAAICARFFRRRGCGQISVMEVIAGPACFGAGVVLNNFHLPDGSVCQSHRRYGDASVRGSGFRVRSEGSSGARPCGASQVLDGPAFCALPHARARQNGVAAVPTADRVGHVVLSYSRVGHRALLHRSRIAVSSSSPGPGRTALMARPCWKSSAARSDFPMVTARKLRDFAWKTITLFFLSSL